MTREEREEAKFILERHKEEFSHDFGWDISTIHALDLAIEILSLSIGSETGHWIDDTENEIDAQYGRHLYKCSECNEYADMFVGGTDDWWDLEKPNYCPNCGAKMVEPQEGSGKE